LERQKLLDVEIVEAIMCERPHSPSVQICFIRQTQEIKMPKVVDRDTSSKTKLFDHPSVDLTNFVKFLEILANFFMSQN